MIINYVEVKNKRSDSVESGQDSAQQLNFPIMLKVMTDDETREYHLKKFAEWGKNWKKKQKGELVFAVDRNVYRNGDLLAEEPNDEEKEWAIHKMKAPARAWNTSIEHKPWILRWHYFVLGDYP